jgi:uridine kinase
MPRVVIIDGVVLLRPEVMPFFDIAVWINCPLNIATERGKARDRAEGADEDHIKRWDREWTPKEEMYAATYHPEKLASFLYDEWE